MNGNEYSVGKFWKVANERGLDAQIHQAIRKVFPTKADAIFHKLSGVQVTRNRKMSSWGLAYLTRGELCMQEILDTKGDLIERNTTFMHEAAHFIAYWGANDHGHGAVWKNVMITMGLEPARCSRKKETKDTIDMAKCYTAVYECLDCGDKFGRSKRWQHILDPKRGGWAQDPVISGRYCRKCYRVNAPNKGVLLLASFKGQSTKHYWPQPLKAAA